MKFLQVEEIQKIIKEKIPADMVQARHTRDAHFYEYMPLKEIYPSVTGKCSILDVPHLKKWAAKLAVEYIIRKVNPGDLLPGRIMELKEPAVLAHQDEFEEAGDIGTKGHKVVESYLMEWMATGQRPADIRTFVKDEDDRIFAIARSAEKFCIDFGVLPIASELLVASPKHKFAGTLDSLMMVSRVTQKGSSNCDAKDLYNGQKKAHDYWRASTKDPSKLMCKDCGQEVDIEFSLVDWKTSNSVDKVEYAMQTSAYWQALNEMTGLKPKRIYIVRLDKKQSKYDVVTVTHRPSCFKAFKLCAKIHDWLEDGNPKIVPADPKERIDITKITPLNEQNDTRPVIEFTEV